MPVVTAPKRVDSELSAVDLVKLGRGETLDTALPDPFTTCRDNVIAALGSEDKLRRFFVSGQDPLRCFRIYAGQTVSAFSFDFENKAGMAKAADLLRAVVQSSNSLDDLEKFSGLITEYAQRRGGQIDLIEAHRLIGNRAEPQRIEFSTKLLDAGLPDWQFFRLAKAVGQYEPSPEKELDYKRMVSFVVDMSLRRENILDEKALAAFERALGENSVYGVKALADSLSAVNNVEIGRKPTFDSESLARVVQNARKYKDKYSTALWTAEHLARKQMPLFKELVNEFESWLASGVRSSTIAAVKESLYDRQPATVGLARALKEQLEVFPENVYVDTVLSKLNQLTGSRVDVDERGQSSFLTQLRACSAETLLKFCGKSQGDLDALRPKLSGLKGSERNYAVLGAMRSGML